MTALSITQQDLLALTVEDVAALAKRLEQDDYPNPFEALEDWHCLRAIALHRPELVQPYLYLLDIEAYDEA